jgi:hypothetical protein
MMTASWRRFLIWFSSLAQHKPPFDALFAAVVVGVLAVCGSPDGSRFGRSPT